MVIAYKIKFEDDGVTVVQSVNSVGTDLGGDAGDDPSRGGDAGDDPSKGGDAGDDPSKGGDAGDDPSKGGDAGDDPSKGGDAGDDPSRGGRTGGGIGRGMAVVLNTLFIGRIGRSSSRTGPPKPPDATPANEAEIAALLAQQQAEQNFIAARANVQKFQGPSTGSLSKGKKK